MWLTLWIDLCLILGVLFTGTYGNIKMASEIKINNFLVDSNSHDGAVFITIISIWTGVLAICSLLAFRKSHLQNALPTS